MMLDFKRPVMGQSARAPKPDVTMTPLTQLSMRDESVAIGPILPDDTAAIFLWLNDVESVALDLAYRPVDWMNYNNWLEGLSKNPSQVIFAIRHVHYSKIMGFAGLTKLDAVHRSGELGIRIGSEADRGKGYGKGAIRLVMNYAWNHLNLNRVYLSVFASNHRAINAYKAAGFQEEGRQRQAAFINGTWMDMVLMAALRPRNGSGDE
jgi:RimJ/RimL family protein N-acetyltransferase